MICDFFYPNFGGVENHIYYLSEGLIALGHRVIIVTHTYGNRQGIRFLPNGLKVYYLPFANMALQTTFPTLWFSLPLYYDVFVREGVDLVHGHSAFSTMCQEGLLHARTMGIPCVFTDHSLFGFADISSILTNKLLKFSLSDCSSVICVSNTSKENTVLRAALDPKNVYVIPNAILSDQFYPVSKDVSEVPCISNDLSDVSSTNNNVSSATSSNTSSFINSVKSQSSNITIVVLCRLVYRKGIDLLVQVIPVICARNPHVTFLIAGEGPKKVDLEQMRERHRLHHRVKMVGAVPADSVRSILVQGQIFLNTSLTEAFCMAIVEAAACGLYVVSTAVGGIPEVLPDHMISLAPPSADGLIKALNGAIHNLQTGLIDTSPFHTQLAAMYSWTDVTKRTQKVYKTLHIDSQTPLIERLRRVWGCGFLAGKFLCIVMVWNHFFLMALKRFYPTHEMAFDTA
jgi:phosphatidylinositol N-acetylglucosaminyltransferase subunit A